MRTSTIRALVAAAMLAPTALAAQERAPRILATGFHFHGLYFDEALGVKAANLMLAPLAYTAAIGDKLFVDFYSAYARGAVLQNGEEFTLSGPVDTRVRVSYSVTPWASVLLGANLPTGNATHTSQEAIVAGVLSTTVLGFREASWGTGSGVTPGLATAYRFGGWGVGLGASYRVSSEFEPRADTTLNFAPGNEARVRVGADRNLGRSGKLTLGVTFQNYSEDRVSGRNLFQSGNCWMGDGALSFRTGRSSTWTLYVANIWREHSDLTLDVVDGTGAVAGDTLIVVGPQNLVVGSLVGAISIGSTALLRPSLEGRVQTKSDVGEAWIFSGGLDLPFRLGSFELVPAARGHFGNLDDPDGVARQVWGGELSLTLSRRL